MKFKLMVLGKNIKTNEDNEKDTYEIVSKKLKEEYEELQEAIQEGDRIHIAEEAFDVIQVVIRLLVLLVKDGYRFEELNKRHNKKLVKRGWKSKSIIKGFTKNN